MKVLVFLFCFFAVAYSNDWMKSPYGDNDEFNTKARFGDNISLQCNDSRSLPSERTIYKWILPNLDIADKNYNKSYKSLDGDVNLKVIEDGEFLLISKVQEEHFGFYYCVGSLTNGEEFVIKKGLNYNGYYFGNLWRKYKKATIVGLSTSLPLMAALLVALAIHSRMTWNDEDIPIEMKNIPLHLLEGAEENGIATPTKEDSVIEKQPVSIAYDNRAYDSDLKDSDYYSQGLTTL
ncbi:unnamed protein product [Dimorphilus gyrociliatus]|uniref:Ig-like domain-containing protein n=1 Tax=Dimorphilus gyrociliatus TaxID=2664684 RepID=A0A7I8VMA7_9ANNE|nr:unnamed protein product [Dimorphilus gyrociliatus]